MGSGSGQAHTRVRVGLPGRVQSLIVELGADSGKRGEERLVDTLDLRPHHVLLVGLLLLGALML